MIVTPANNPLPATFGSPTYPWQSLRAIKALRIAAPLAVRSGHVQLPGSKSLSNRALLLAAVAHGTSVVTDVLAADDTHYGLGLLRTLGIGFSLGEGGEVLVQGCGGKLPPCAMPLWLGAAGTLLRFVPGLLAAAGEGTYTLNGEGALARRPIADLIAALHQLGAQCAVAHPGRSLPLHIEGGSLRGGVAQISGRVSSQFISGLLLAAPFAQDPITIEVRGPIVQKDYVALTSAALSVFGYSVAEESFTGGYRYQLQPQKLSAVQFAVEADVSCAGYFFALAAISGVKIHVTPINKAGLQPDLELLRCLQTMGCEVQWSPTGVVVHRQQPLRCSGTVDLSAFADSMPALAVVAAFAQGTLHITGIGHTRFHECDRIAAMAYHLAMAGVEVAAFEDSLSIGAWPARDRQLPLDVNPCDDHRIAMACSLLALRGTPIILQHPGCVCKTVPDYFARLESFGFNFYVIEEN